MLDAAFIREHLDAVKANCRNRNVKADVDRVVQLDDERKRLAQRNADASSSGRTRCPNSSPRRRTPPASRS